MADDARDVVIDIIGRDKTGRATTSARRNFEQLSKSEKKSTKDTDNLEKKMAKLGKTVAGWIRPALRVVSTVAAFGGAAGAAALDIVKLGKGLVVAAKAGASFAAALAPLVAFLPGLALAGGLLFGTIKASLPGVTAALAPISQSFVDADGNATKLTKHVQDLAAKGVEPLAKSFVKLNIPTIASGMDRIAVAENGVTTGVLRWLDSAQGQLLIRQTTEGTATAFERLAPHITSAAIEVGNLATRAGNKAITGFADLVGRILDKFTAWAASTSTEDINRALGKLHTTFDQVKAGWDKLKGLGGWLDANTPKIKAFSDTLATLSIVGGIASGNWIAVLVGGLSLVNNNLGYVKKTWQSFTDWLKSSGTQDIIDRIRKVADPEIVKAFKDSLSEIMETIRTHGPEIKQIITAVVTVFLALAIAAAYAIRIISTIMDVFFAIQDAFALTVRAILLGFGIIINAAASAFGWVPGLGPKLKQAASDFNDFSSKVNHLLDGLNGKQVKVNIVVGLTGSGAKFVDNQGQVTIAGAGLVKAFAGGMSWAGRNYALGMAGDGHAADAKSRTGGPAPVRVDNTLNANLTVELDGKVIGRRVQRVIDRQAWRDKVGKR